MSKKENSQDIMVQIHIYTIFTIFHKINNIKP
jgi:hypothetical protein